MEEEVTLDASPEAALTHEINVLNEMAHFYRFALASCVGPTLLAIAKADAFAHPSIWIVLIVFGVGCFVIGGAAAGYCLYKVLDARISLIASFRPTKYWGFNQAQNDRILSYTTRPEIMKLIVVGYTVFFVGFAYLLLNGQL